MGHEEVMRNDQNEGNDDYGKKERNGKQTRETTKNTKATDDRTREMMVNSRMDEEKGRSGDGLAKKSLQKATTPEH